MEFIGAAAALTQLAKYGIDIANGIPEFSRRLRNAPASVQEWTDHTSLLVSLTQILQQQPTLLQHVQPEIIVRLHTYAEKVASLLQQLTAAAKDGKMERMKKRVQIVRKEKEVEKALKSIGLVSNALQAHLLYVCSSKSKFILC